MMISFSPEVHRYDSFNKSGLDTESVTGGVGGVPVVGGRVDCVVTVKGRSGAVVTSSGAEVFSS